MASGISWRRLKNFAVTQILNQNRLCEIKIAPTSINQFTPVQKQCSHPYSNRLIPTSMKSFYSSLLKIKKSDKKTHIRRWTSHDSTQTQNEKKVLRIFGRRNVKYDSVDSAAWACRLANENGYLSWCRNSYLMTGVGVGMLYKGQTKIAELAGYSAIFLSGVNVSWGTAIFIYNMVFLQKRVLMSTWFVFLQSMSAIAHALAYVSVLIIFSVESDKTFEKEGKWISTKVEVKD